VSKCVRTAAVEEAKADEGKCESLFYKQTKERDGRGNQLKN
jgi:hypothetical protein